MELKSDFSSHGAHHTARGFTLLEVLIALVVLSIGLLGIAALQGVGLRTSHGAHLASQASLLAYDMADRIRANPQNFWASHDFTSADFSTDDIDCSQPSPVTPLAVVDRWEWSCSIEDLLPQGTGTISGGLVAGTDARRYIILIEWQDLQAGEDPWSFELEIEI
jgi:type IV pilus assembly protein PilV